MRHLLIAAVVAAGMSFASSSAMAQGVYFGGPAVGVYGGPAAVRVGRPYYGGRGYYRAPGVYRARGPAYYGGRGYYRGPGVYGRSYYGGRGFYGAPGWGRRGVSIGIGF